jgi:hypothetical protein
MPFQAVMNSQLCWISEKRSADRTSYKLDFFDSLHDFHCKLSPNSGFGKIGEVELELRTPLD